MRGCANKEIKPARVHTHTFSRAVKMCVCVCNGPVGQDSLLMFRKNLSNNDRSKRKYTYTHTHMHIHLRVQRAHVSCTFAYSAQTCERSGTDSGVGII